jgi:hypothetical protein
MPTIPSLRRHLARFTLAALALSLGLLTSCSTTDKNTTVVDGLDCGLVRADLFGDWTVTFTGATVNTVNCKLSADDNIPITTSATPLVFSNVAINGSDDSPSLQVVGTTAAPEVNPELTVGIGADSCLALARVWIQTENVYLDCFGTFDRTTGAYTAYCDSAELDLTPTPDGVIDDSCDLDATISAFISIT